MEVERRVIPIATGRGDSGSSGDGSVSATTIPIALSPRRTEESHRWKIIGVGLVLVVVLALVVSAGVKASKIEGSRDQRVNADVSTEVVFGVLADRVQFGQISNVFEYEVSKQCGLPSYLVSVTKVEEGERSGGVLYAYVSLSGPSEQLLTFASRRLFDQWKRGAFDRFNAVRFYEFTSQVPTRQEGDEEAEVSPIAGLSPDGEFVMRIACGSDMEIYNGPNSDRFQADDFYRGGIALRKTAASRNRLYQSQRYFVQALLGEGYKIPVPNGNYMVRLHFTEIQFAERNTRVFNVLLEDTPIRQTPVDVYGETSSIGTPLILQTIISVGDEMLDINFEKISHNPTISAIEIYSAH